MATAQQSEDFCHICGRDPCDPQCPAYGAYQPPPDDHPPGYCVEAWSLRESLYDDPMSSGAPVGEIVNAWDRNHYNVCKICRDRIDLERMP